MKELDFDELDRAVNSLMGGVAGKTTNSQATKEDDEQTLVIPSTDVTPTAPADLAASQGATDATASITDDNTTASLISDDTPTDTASVADVAESEAPALPEAPAATTPDLSSDAAAATPLAARRSGRFMDVVHPSSDMKNPLNAPSEQPSRQSASLSPLSSDLSSDEQPSSEPDVAAPEAASTVTAAASDWPDPLADYTAGSSDTDESTDDEPATADDSTDVVDQTAQDAPLVTPDVTADAEPVPADQPLTTPFLTDAKVDKRPLGGMTPAEPVAEPEAEATTDTTSSSDDELGRAPVLGALVDEGLTSHDPDDQLPPSAATATKTETTLPAELQGDVMAIESDTTAAASVAPAPVTEQPSVAPAQPATPAAPVVAKTQPKQAAKVATPAAPTGPSSIQPQYKEAASTGDQDNGSIYDTRGYHQPLEHPAKKKSGWLWIVWVLVILILGAASGAALYLFDII